MSRKLTPNLAKDDLVFPSPEGRPIDDHNFTMRTWKTVLEKAGVEYRTPYTTRATFISHSIRNGTPPINVAKITGHDVKTMYEYYAGVIDNSLKIPEF